MGSSQRPIPRDELRRRLVQTAQVRSLVLMVSFFASLAIAHALLGKSAWEGSVPPAAAFMFGCPLLAAWLMTRFYCRPAVRCPRCGQSLWDCGTGNFKVRRMRVRENVRECPNCRTPIV